MAFTNSHFPARLNDYVYGDCSTESNMMAVEHPQTLTTAKNELAENDPYEAKIPAKVTGSARVPAQAGQELPPVEPSATAAR